MTTTSTSTGAPDRLRALDGMRGLGALGVVLVHVWMYTTGDIADPGSAWGAALKELRLALMMFFVFSGYLLFRPWVAAALRERPAPDARRYAVRRLARVAPLYWVALLGSLAVLAGTGHPHLPELRELPVFALFAQNYFAATSGELNPPMWSLVAEVSFYAVLPVLGWIAVRAGGRGGMLALCGLLVVAGTAFNAIDTLAGWPSYVRSWLPSLVPCFAAGMAVAVVVHGRRIGRRAAMLLLGSGVVLVAANGVWHATGEGWLALRLFRDLPAAVGFALVVAASHGPRGLRLLSLRPLQVLGDLSYGIYIWHMPAILLLVTRDALPGQLLPALVVVLVLTVGAAAVTWRWVEQPCMRRAAAWRPAPRRGGATARRAGRPIVGGSSA